MAEETVTHYAKSVFTDLTAWAIVILGVIVDPETKQLMLSIGIDPAIVGRLVTGAALLSRIVNAKRPVAFVAPGEVKKVEVPKIPESKVA